MSSPPCNRWIKRATALAGIGVRWPLPPSPVEQQTPEGESEAERLKRMATPFLATLKPSNLQAYKRGLPRSQQSDTVPPAFLDAMEVREQVFVQEQKVPADNEFDDDDSRSCHFVVYASVRETISEEVCDEKTGEVLIPRKSDARRVPIGTIRIVPFPHDPHPIKGAKYWGGKMEEELITGQAKEEKIPPPTVEKTELGYFVDRATTFHDGQEPYLKLGRLAVVKEYRGQRMASFLVRSAVQWLRDNPYFFDPSVAAKGLAPLDAVRSAVPQWKGLICVHAQAQVVDAWQTWGFKIDEEMGTWDEEGIPHVGMFLRLDIEKPPPGLRNPLLPPDFPGNPFVKLQKITKKKTKEEKAEEKKKKKKNEGEEEQSENDEADSESSDEPNSDRQF